MVDGERANSILARSAPVSNTKRSQAVVSQQGSAMFPPFIYSLTRISLIDQSDYAYPCGHTSLTLATLALPHACASLDLRRSVEIGGQAAAFAVVHRV